MKKLFNIPDSLVNSIQLKIQFLYNSDNKKGLVFRFAKNTYWVVD